MDKKKLEHFKASLLKHRQQILNGGLLNNSEDLYISEEDLSDETDLASSVVNQQISCSIRDREIFKLRRIDQALERVQDGTYGHCEDCDEEIGLKRLENQPWVELCIVHAEEKEREEAQIYRQA
jgi:DnaK suppressor protein